MNTNAYLDALDALVDTRPMLDPNNYGSIAAYRADQRANMRRIAGTPAADELIEAAKGSRLSFVSVGEEGIVSVDYCAGQYYPREYRAACVRLLARCWWERAGRQFADDDAEGIRKLARRMFGRGVASRWFN